MANVTVKAGEFAFGPTVVTTVDTVVPLVDTVSGVGGDGSYYISLTSAGAIVVTRINGIAPPNETPTQIAQHYADLPLPAGPAHGARQSVGNVT